MYQHGIYAQHATSGLKSAVESSSLGVYIGVSPVHQLMGDTTKDVVVCNNDYGATMALGYSDNWEKYSLSEAHYLHFKGETPIGLIACINVLDPAVDRKSTPTVVQVLFANGLGIVMNDGVILTTLTIAGKTQGIDYTLTYNTSGTGVDIHDITGTLTGMVGVEFIEIDTQGITPQRVAEAIKVNLPKVYEVAGRVPSLIACPGWSHHKIVNDAMVTASVNINGHWNGFVFSDIDVTETHDITAVMEKKNSEGRITANQSPCWPMVADDKHVYHLSTVAVMQSQIIDRYHGGLPFETTSNKVIPMNRLVIKKDGVYKPITLDKIDANRLNGDGIKTAIFWAGYYRIWGPHTGAVSANPVAQTPVEHIFDCSVRMAQHLGHVFQIQYGDEVDKPMHRSRIDTILNDFGGFMDSLVNVGALLHGEIVFRGDENKESDLMNGHFVFATGFTTTPPGKAIINRFKYTSKGLTALTGGDDNG